MTQFDLGKVVGENAPKITDIEKTGTSGLVDTYTITLEDGSSYTFDVTNGADGSEVSITQVLSSGTKLATLTIDGTSTDLYCSEGGTADIVTEWEQILSDEKVPSEKLTKNSLDGKADSVHTHTKSQITDFPSLSTVATTGDYDDLLDKPSIPSSSSDLSDGSDLIKKSQTAGLVKNDGTIDTTSYVSDISGKADKTSGASQITDPNAHSNIGTSANATQSQINTAIDTMIGQAIQYITQ